MVVINYSLSEIQEVGRFLLDTWKKPSIVIFSGDPGVGKSTLIYELIKQIETEQWYLQSPTYTKVHEYSQVIHMDLYYESFNNYDDYFHQDKWVFVEWGNTETVPWDFQCILTTIDHQNRKLAIINNI
jgi:tRNA threonylcarbamoyl adenosine modification protein YjeE